MRKKHDWNYLVYIDGSTDKKNITDGNTVTFYGLKPGTVYSYSIQTEFHGLQSTELASVGTEQTQNAATMQENRPKNRFINVLPYDRSRVKLTSSSPQNDYINASYMPVRIQMYKFIAAQGPLPNTVNDFWRMIWEQQVTGIVMVTNCTEGGRIKCEQYWPESNPRHCGDLEVFTTSEKKQLDWTLREFKVKQVEERTVRHFHFTAWPDHGVPQGTQVLIQFRELVRQHMQTEAAGTPTVVHCSAGVGRTGTLIALDMLLQQMEKEKAVDIYGFVYKMRLNRPHMVQTEVNLIVILHYFDVKIKVLSQLTS
uniref:protein-tyrosine-phosphatase n=1 Tax=Periophthalmus magnuspinnatus TaxID=409849 RepID=A0A3B3ZNR9_9GOBI